MATLCCHIFLQCKQPLYDMELRNIAATLSDNIIILIMPGGFSEFGPVCVRMCVKVCVWVCVCVWERVENSWSHIYYFTLGNLTCFRGNAEFRNNPHSLHWRRFLGLYICPPCLYDAICGWWDPELKLDQTQHCEFTIVTKNYWTMDGPQSVAI